MKVLSYNPELCVGCYICEEVCSDTWFKVTDTEESSIRIYEESGVDTRYPDAEKIADKAYQSSDHPTLRTPHKKPKGGALTPEQKEANRHLAQQRIYVEHGIRRVKGWRILRDDYRLAVGLFATVTHAVVGLVQLGRILG